MRWIHGSCCQAAYLTFSQTTCLLLRLSVLFCPRLCPLCDNTLTPGAFQHAAITRHKELYSTIILSSGPCSIAHMLLAMFHFDVSDVKIGQRWKLMNQPPKRPAIIIWPPFSSSVFLFLLVMKHVVHSGWHPVLQCGTIYAFNCCSNLSRTFDSHDLWSGNMSYI